MQEAFEKRIYTGMTDCFSTGRCRALDESDSLCISSIVSVVNFGVAPDAVNIGVRHTVASKNFFIM